MVESEFTFFEMQVECRFMDATELCQSCFRNSPEVLYTIDMVRAFCKFVLSMFDSMMSFIPEIDQAIIGFEPISIDNRFFIDFFPDDG
jgi:hypothetical protein